MAVKAPPIKSPFIPLRLPPGGVTPDLLRQNFDRIQTWAAGLSAHLQTNYITLPSASTPSSAMTQGFYDPTISNNNDGIERVVTEFVFDGSIFPLGTLTASFSMLVSSTVGTAKISLYVGGAFSQQLGLAPGAGAQLGVNGTPSSTLVPKKLTGTFLNTGATVPIQITLKASATGGTAHAKLTRITGVVHA